jgi:ABC-type dipeptide/oligopeptide/nickel transport system ATPase component
MNSERGEEETVLQAGVEAARECRSDPAADNMAPTAEPLLRIRDLTVGYHSGGRPVYVVRHVDLAIKRGEIIGLVGESGSGKTQTARAILRLNSKPLRPLSGQIIIDGIDLLTLPENRMRDIRGKKVAMIFQDPRSALNPLMRVGDQLARVFALHQGISRRAAHVEAVDMLRRVGITGPERVSQSYPHQLSGGMCQRVMIGMALGIRPALLIADEPTTGLDVTIQAQILDLIRTVQAETGTSLLLITHDLGVVAETCRRVAVMYAGHLVELANVDDLFDHPRHPYTVRLLRSTLGTEGIVQPDAAISEVPRSVLFEVCGERFQASLDVNDAPDSESTMIELSADHVVRGRPSPCGQEMSHMEHGSGVGA